MNQTTVIMINVFDSLKKTGNKQQGQFWDSTNQYWDYLKIFFYCHL